MWFRKKAPEYVCVGCGCLMRKARKEVETWEYGIGRAEFYCGICAPSYDVRRRGGDGYNTLFITGAETIVEKARYYRKESAKETEITEKGKAIS